MTPLKTFLKVLEYSGAWIGIVINPAHWTFGVKINPEDDPGIFYFEINLGLVWLRIVIDDGSW